MNSIKNIHRKILTLCMAIALLVSSCVIPIYAAGDTIDVDMVGFPNGSNAGWQIPAVSFKSGWNHEASDYYT